MKRVQNTVAQHRLWGTKESFIVAVSGGPDSLCLLDVLFLLSHKYDFTLHIVHVNYRLRGQDSDKDEECVRKSAVHYRIPLTVIHPPKTTRSNLEEQLRNMRYRLLEQVRVKHSATLIAVAHHEDDQAETLLLRLLRGSGMLGLSAMRPKNGAVVRPLLTTKRSDIIRYMKERHIAYRHDQSNADPMFLRNRIRHSLIPYIEKRFQPNIKHLLAETATLLATDYALLTSLPSFSPINARGVGEFSVTDFQKLPESLAHHSLRLMLTSYSYKKSPPRGVILEVQKLIMSTKNKRQTLHLPGLIIERRGAIVRLLKIAK